jgi:hypothetical protein
LGDSDASSEDYLADRNVDNKRLSLQGFRKK